MGGRGIRTDIVHIGWRLMVELLVVVVHSVADKLTIGMEMV